MEKVQLSNKQLTSFASFFTVPIFLFKILGITPFINAIIFPLPNKLFQCFGYFSMFILYTSFILEILYLIINAKSLSFIIGINGFLIAIFTGLSSVKTIVFLWNRHKTNALVHDLQNIHPIQQNKFNVYRISKNTNLFFKIYAVGYNAMVSVFYVLPVSKILYNLIVNTVDYQLSLPFLMWFPFDPIGSNWVYTILMLYQFWGATSAGALQLACDSMLFSFGIQICMHFDWLSNTIKNLKTNGIDDGGQHDYQKLSQYIKRHNEIIRLTAELDAIFCGPILFHFLSSSMIICIVGFMVIITKDVMELLKYIFAMGSIVMQLFIICWLGDRFIASVNIKIHFRFRF